MEQLDLFATGELVTIREYLQGWNAATRARVLSKKATSGPPGNTDGEEVMRPS